MKKLVYATGNPGKFAEVSKLFAAFGMKLHEPKEFGVTIEVDETGATLEENAILKAEAYRDRLPPDTIVLGDDTGVEIQALGGEPGIKVRRWKGYSMADQEIFDYCLERMKNIPEGHRQAQFRTVIAVAAAGCDTKVFSGTTDGEILSHPAPQNIPGFPFETLFYVPKWKRTLGDIYGLAPIERATYQTHRYRAIVATLPYLSELQGVQTSSTARQ